MVCGHLLETLNTHGPCSTNENRTAEAASSNDAKNTKKLFLASFELAASAVRLSL